MRTRWPVVPVLAVALAGAVVVLASCAGEKPNMPKPDLRGLDKKLSTFAFIEEGNLVSFIVDTRPARYREEGGYLPLEICVANRGVKLISLTRESFTLRDSQGNEYPCIGPKELLQKYDFLDLDRRLAELHEIVFNRFGAFVQYPSSFSPLRVAPANVSISTVVRDSIGLPKFGYFIDFIYFPTPKTGVLNQRFELWMRARELPDPVFVKFAVL